jgi:Fe-S oxidoreductase
MYYFGDLRLSTANTATGAEPGDSAKPEEKQKLVNVDNIKEAFDSTQAYNCLECGKCTGVCPVALTNSGFSPRLLVKRALLEFEEELCFDKELWDCLTCDLCRARCRSDVNLPEFIRRLRMEGRRVDNLGVNSHNNVFNLIAQIQLKAGDKQDRLSWVTPDIKYHNKGKTLYFVGCAPYFNSVFKEMGQDNLAAPLASLRLLNKIDIEPVLMGYERCCGHDQFWTGDQDTFERLLVQNITNFRNAGVEQIVTSCPECHFMLDQEYRNYSDKYDIECKHITELLADKQSSGELKIPNVGENLPAETVSYHDSCRLGRFSGIYDAPRKIIEAIPGAKLSELARNRTASACCGVNSFINCDMNSRNWRAAKLGEAKDAGADTLVTGCHKCAIHLNCYVSNEHVEPKFDIKVESLVVKLAEALGLMQDNRPIMND